MKAENLLMRSLKKSQGSLITQTLLRANEVVSQSPERSEGEAISLRSLSSLGITLRVRLHRFSYRCFNLCNRGFQPKADPPMVEIGVIRDFWVFQKSLIAAGIAGLLVGLASAGSGGELTAREILIKSDAIVNAPLDREIVAELVINEEGRREVKRIVRIWQKGEKRIFMFLYPDRLRRTAILTLPDNVTYLYLPIWREAERISIEEIEEDFLDIGFTSADMEALIIRIDDYEPTLVGSEKLQGFDHYILELKIKEGIDTDYPALKVWIRKDEFYPVMIEQYNREGKLRRVVKADKWEKIDGYWFPWVSVISDLKREREIEVRITEVAFDQELENELFTPGKLKRLHRLE